MINSSEMSIGFHDASRQSAPIWPIRIAQSVSEPSSFKQYIYSWMALDELIKVLKKQPRDTFDPENDRLERFSIRFVIDTSGNPWFALEGEVSVLTPAHSQMVDQDAVLTAGNIVLSEDYSTIIEITNKSGHYLPEFNTLVFFIKMLFAVEADSRFSLKIAPEMKIVRYAKQSSFIPDPISHITLSKEALYSLLPIDFMPQIQAYPFAKLRKAEGIQSVFDSYEDYFNHKNPKPSASHSFLDELIPRSPDSRIKRKPRRSLLPFDDSSSSYPLAGFGLFGSASSTPEKRSFGTSTHNVLGMYQLLASNLTPGHSTSPEISKSDNAPFTGSPIDENKATLFSKQRKMENTLSTKPTLVL